jgi:hypothetical protein
MPNFNKMAGERIAFLNIYINHVGWDKIVGVFCEQILTTEGAFSLFP